MKCPNCGMDMETEVYRQMRKENAGVQMIVFCPKGDFMSDSTIPSKVVSEVESAEEWNNQKAGNR